MRLTKYNNISIEKQKKTQKKNNTPINYRNEEIYSSDEININQRKYIPNKDKNKILMKRNPNIIYNKIKQQYTPIKREIKIYPSKNKLIKEDLPLNEDKFLKDNNILFSNKKKNRSYCISPQREINLAYIQQDNQTFNNNNYFNNNFYKINNTQSNFYIGKAIKPHYKNNFYHNIIYSNKNSNKDINSHPQSDCLLENNTYNRSDIYNKTEENFFKYKKIYKPKIYGRNNDKNINKYNNHKVTEILYTRKNNNSYLNKEEITDGSDIYLDLYDNNSFYYRPQVNNELTSSEILYNKINYINNSNKKKNIIRIIKNNETTNDNKNNSINTIERDKGIYLRKNKTELVTDSIQKKIKNSFLKKNNNNNMHNNNKLTEILDNNYHNKDFSFQRNPLTNKNENENKEELSLNRIIVKKRPIKENSNSYNGISEYTKIQNKTFEKIKKFDICKNISFNYENKSDKLIFDNEDNIIEYINKKYEEEKKKTYFNRKIKFTGFILTKKYKGKTLYDIRIEDDINHINNKLKEEKVEVNHELIQINFVKKNNEENELKNRINNLEKELLKYKEENDLLSKKDNLKNELIKKLDKEKQNLIEEIKKINDEIEATKKINDNLNSKLLYIKNDFHLKNYETENILSFSIEKENNKKIFDNKKLNKEKMEIYYISKNIDNSNILSLNNNLSNGEIENESKKNILFRLSKISDIKENKIEQNDSKDTIIKKNIDMLNYKLNNLENYEKDNEE